MQHKRWKQSIALLLVLCMCLTMLPATAYATDADRTQAQSEAAEQAREDATEDASEQLGDYTPPAPQETSDPEAAVSQTGTSGRTTTEKTPEPQSGSSAAAARPQGSGTAANEGRSSADQQILTVDGTDYILIGTKQQLQALDYYPTTITGSANNDQLTENKRYDVMGPIWRVTEKRDNYLSNNWYVSNTELVYPGDNNLTGTFADYPLYGENDCITDPNHGVADTHKLGETVVTQTETHLLISYDMERDYYVGGTLDTPNRDIDSYDYGKYSPRGNIVIFRDIDLNNEAWEPMMFYGLMYGVKGSELDVTLEEAVRAIRASEDAQDYAELVQPTVSNVLVTTPAQKMDPDKYVGVGFFASVTSSRPGADSGFSQVKAEVRNLKLDTVSITNNFTGIQVNETLISALVETLGTGVGALLDFLLRLLTGKDDFNFIDSVRDLLTARAKDPTNLATGSFVGRVYGDVLLENCDVVNATVNSGKSYVGGFVGYSAGEEKYDIVSQGLGGVLKLLTTVLNLIPGLGLGDLISIVQNVLPLNTLIPVDYLNPHVEDCDLTNLTGTLGPAGLSWSFNNGTEDALCNGGFIGCKIATVMIGCGVHDSSYTVYAKQYAGGFAGLARDAVIQELLTDLGINLGIMQSLLNRLLDSSIDLQSVQVRCSITGSDVTVSGDEFIGGFNGAMTNAYSINNQMLSQGKTLTVNGTGNCVGGYAGIATLGWAMSMGEGEANGNTSLLSTLKNVLTSLTGSYGTELLSLLGVGQSEILGLQFDYRRTESSGNGASVTGYDYVGGLVGKADALIMTGTTAANLSKMTYFQNGDLTAWDVFPDMPKTGEYTVTYHDMDGSTTTQTVTAADNYTINLPNRSDRGDYKFVGWITAHYDHTIGEPDDVIHAGDPYLVTRDITLNALYSIEGETVWELITGTPVNWETEHNTYILTYGREEESMRVLTGLDDDVNYETASSGGATTVAQIRGTDDSLFVVSSGILISNVPDLYLFTADQVASTKDYYFKNVGKNTYLRCALQVSTHRLEASSNAYLAGTQWHPSITDDLNALFENDLDTTSKPYITYNSSGYFLMGTQAEANANKLYLWGETKLPTRYTTVEAGAEFPQENDSVSLDNDSIGVFAQIHANGLELVNGHKYVGGIAGLAGTANVSGLLNDTIGVGDFQKFDFSDIEVTGGTELTEGSSEHGLTVYGHVPNKGQDVSEGFYVAGGIGMAIGGDLHRIGITRLVEIEGANCVGGFAGCVGPGDLISTGGLNVQLLGLSLLSANKLLSVGDGILTDVRTVTVQGVPQGFTVNATGENTDGSQIIYNAGGFFGRANSSSVRDGHVDRLLWVKANETDGRAGGFVGVSEVGGLASMDSAEGTQIKSLLSAGNLLKAVGYLIPEYTLVDTTYVNGGYVQAACAGGFAADFRSGTVDNDDKAEGDWYAVYNIDHVTGTHYAGGFGGKLWSGALAEAGGGISILGGISNLNIGLKDLLDLIQAYVPAVNKAGVKSDGEFNKGFVVTVTGADPDDKTTGAAGGFAGYASGAQISYSDVLQLRHTEVEAPTELDGKEGDSYFDNRSAYAVTGTRYAGGYAGFLDIGSSASLGGGLKVLGDSISAANVLSALNVVISTVEHSDVYGGPGGFAVKASWTVPGATRAGTRSAEDEITVYVVDQTNSPNFYAYIFNSASESNEGTAWHGHQLECLGKDFEGNNYYSFTVDPTLYDRVIFNNGETYQNSDENCLKLDELAVSQAAVYNDNAWKVSVGSDIWPSDSAEASAPSCRGSYTRYTGVLGTVVDVETVTDGSKSHTYGVWTPSDGVNTHYHECVDCGCRELQDCTIDHDYCTVCGRRDATLPGSIAEAPGLAGRSGGFVGWLRGSHIQDSNAWNFSYIIGQIAAGGYTGEMEPGSVADALGSTEVLGGLAEVSGSPLLSIAKDFVPTIRNSVTTSIPCGGAVRANAFSDSEVQRGMAGGYVGHNCGGQIWGNNDDPWKDENETVNNKERYNGPKSECAAIRILSVYGAEYAGGFTGLMDAGSTAGTGNISLLFDLVKLNGLLDALKVSYPTEENTAVYGPLEQMTPAVWNAWVEYVGQYGGYGMGMEAVAENISAEDFAAMLEQYIYGFHVTAGRDTYQNDAKTVQAGCAGGYVGSMRSGTITNGQAYDVKQVKAMRNAGGFAGDMKTGSVANLGQAEALGLNLDLSQLLTGALDVFVPVVKTSSVHGYQNGMTVIAFGDQVNGCGNAGGFAGTARGAQIWGDAETDSSEPGCNVFNLKKVQGTRYVGGYIGSLGSGTVAEAGTNVSEGPLQDLLDSVIKSGSDQVSSLLSLAGATVSTVRKATITVADPEWGFTVGRCGDSIPLCAGGFVGTMEGAIIGNNKDKNVTATNIQVNGLRGVEAQYYAGGFFGAANVGSTASVAQNKTNLLSLVNLGQVSALDIFRPYIYNSNVNGVAEGFTVRTSGAEKQGIMASSRYSGCAGGFGGALLSGHVENANVTNLNSVSGVNYVGGFVGHCGKSGIADADSASVLEQLNVLSAQAGVGDIIGSKIETSSVTGIETGYTVDAAGGSEPVAGGFVGYDDLGIIRNSTASALKYVTSDQIAGGFIGKTVKGFLIELQASSSVVALLLNVVNVLVRALYLPEAEQANFLNANLAGLVGVQLLNEGNLLGVNLLGIRITVALGTKEDEGGATDVAKITIGDSYIELPCNEDGLIDPEHSNLTIRLLPVAYVHTENCTVTGVEKGFDVFAGGATQTEDGAHRSGYAGGFVGFNQLGEITNCQTVNCDVVRGTPMKLSATATTSVVKVGPFTGSYYNDSSYDANGQAAKETGDTYNGTAHTTATPDTVYEDAATKAKVKLMQDTALPANLQTLVPETAEMQNPCRTTVDLTLHKIWDDMDGTLGLRASATSENPVTVTFTVWKVTNGDTANAVVYETVTLTAADANAFTGNVWTKKLTGLPATELVNDSLVRYTYFVTEAEVSGYITGVAYADADPADKLTFSAEAGTGYVAKLTNQAALEQTVVVDFGLPVSVSVVDYLKEKYEYPVSGMQIAGILPVNELQSVSRYGENQTLLADALDVNPDGSGVPTPAAPTQENRVRRYGTFEVPAKVGENPVTKLRYVPGSMMFDKPVQIAVALRGRDGVNYYTKLTVVPATTIYFEDDFILFSDEWTDAGSTEAGEQDEDRPGADVLDMNSVYGWDHRYSNGTTYSLGNAQKVTVTKGMTPTAQFTYTGTGFDVLAVTDKTTGFMTVEVYSGTEAVGTPMAKWAVDTFYGCTRRPDGYIRYLCVWDETASLWRVAKTAYPDMTDEEAADKVGTTEDGCRVLADYPDDLDKNHNSFIVYKKNYVWETNGTGSTLYQVPVVSARDAGVELPYGTYTVVLRPQYASVFDHDKSDASYTLYVDGVRIYRPAQGLDESYYLQDHEGWPQFIEMRKLLLGQDGFGQTQEDENQGIVFIDGGIVVRDLADFTQYGPNNEIYLEPGQAIAFRLKKGDAARIDQVHVSMKRIFEGEAQVTFTSGTQSDPRTANIPLNTATECYYDLSSVIRWEPDTNETELIVIANTGESTVSLRNLKITFLEAVESEDALVSVVRSTAGQASAALRLLRSAAALPIILDEDPVFEGASVSLESDFSLHFYIPAELLAGKTNPYVLFTKQTQDGPVVLCQYDYLEEMVGDTLCRRYSFPNLSAAEMGAEVTARLFYNVDGADHMSHVFSYSVRQYAMHMLEKTDDPALKTLLVDMLNYGAEAQRYLKVREDNLVNAELTEAQQAFATEAELNLTNQNRLIRREEAAVWFEGCSLSLERRVTVNYFLDLSTSGLTAGEVALKITWEEADGTERTAVIDGSAFTARKIGSRTVYAAALDELNAAQMRTVLSAVVLRKADGTCVSDTMRYSIESYAGTKLRTDPAMAALILAMMKYGDAAAAYFSNH